MQIFAIFLVVVVVASNCNAAGVLDNFLPAMLYPVQGGTKNPNACAFNGPQDTPTLRGQNFLENFGTRSCLTFRRSQPKLPVNMGVCSWNSLPTSNQLFNFNNGNGGSIVKTVVSGVFGADTCLSATQFGGQLQAERCSVTGKDFSQTWRFTRVRQNVYQMTHVGQSKCLRVDSTRVGAVPSLVRCNTFDNFQLWRICTSK